MIIHYQTVARPLWRTFDLTPAPSDPAGIILAVACRIPADEWETVGDTEQIARITIYVEHRPTRGQAIHHATVTRQTFDTITIHTEPHT
jgi:hypothetical protein